MAQILQHRRNITSAIAPQVGSAGEIIIDTTKNTVVVMDGVTAGGFPLAKESDIPARVSDLENDRGYITDAAAFSGDYDDLTNKPTLFTGAYNALTGKPVLFSGNYDDLTNKPTIFSGNYNDLTNKPTIFSGNYNDLSNKPNLTIYQLANSAFSGAYEDLTGAPNLSTYLLTVDAFNGNYNDLANLPTIPTDVGDLTDTEGLLGGGSGLPVYSSSTIGYRLVIETNIDGQTPDINGTDIDLIPTTTLNANDWIGSGTNSPSTYAIATMASGITYQITGWNTDANGDSGFLALGGILNDIGANIWPIVITSYNYQELPGGKEIEVGLYSWKFNETGNMFAPGDITTGLEGTGGRFIQDCADGNTSVRWINILQGDSTTQLIRAYTGNPLINNDNERAQIKLNWLGPEGSEQQSGLTIRAFDRTDPESLVRHDWDFQGNGLLVFPGSSNASIGEDEPGLVITSGTGFAILTNANIVNTYEVEFIGYVSNGFGDSAGATLTVTEIIAGTITDGMTIYGAGLPPEGWAVTFGGVMEPQGTGGTGNYLLSGANVLTSSQSFNNGVQAAGSNAWIFQNNGDLIFSDNTVQTTAWAGGRVVSAPATSKGANGNKIGDLAYTSTHYYYCIADYVDGVADIWVRSAWDETTWS